MRFKKQQENNSKGYFDPQIVCDWCSCHLCTLMATNWPLFFIMILTAAVLSSTAFKKKLNAIFVVGITGFDFSRFVCCTVMVDHFYC